MIELSLSIAAFISSTIAAVLGLGGGMILIAIIPLFLPAAAVIPVHGASQLASNASRVIFAYPSAMWQIVPPFLVGSGVGIVAAWYLLRHVPLHWLPLSIGMYILAVLWVPQLKRALSRFSNGYIIGCMQTGIGTLVGATGPLTTSMVLTITQDKERIVVTNAVLMSFSHGAKIFLYGVLGFSFSAYWQAILGMALGAVLGSFVGTKIRAKLNNMHFLLALKITLSLLAFKMIASVFINEFI